MTCLRWLCSNASRWSSESGGVRRWGQHRGDPPFRRCGSAATGVCTRRQFRKLPGALPHESASLSVGPISASVVKLLSSSASNGEFAGGPADAGCRMHHFTGMWLNPNSRGSRLRIWQPWGCNSLHAHHLTVTGFSGKSRPRRLKITETSGCKSRVADPRVVNREQQTGSTQDRTALGVQVSPRRPIWNVNRTSEPDLFAKQWAPRKGSVVRVHDIPPFMRA